METPEIRPAHIDQPEAYYTRAKRWGAIVTRPFGMRLDHETTMRWMEVVSLFRTIDDYLDDFTGTAHDFATRLSQIREGIANPGKVADFFPSLTPENLGVDTYHETQRLGDQIVRLNQFIKTTDSPARYITLRRAEGRVSAQLLAELTSEEFQNQPKFDRFVSGSNMIGETLNLADSFLDIQKDYRGGEINFHPDHTFRPKLLGAIALVGTKYMFNTSR